VLGKMVLGLGVVMVGALGPDGAREGGLGGLVEVGAVGRGMDGGDGGDVVVVELPEKGAARGIERKGGGQVDGPEVMAVG